MTKQELFNKAESGMAALKQSDQWQLVEEKQKAILEVVGDERTEMSKALLVRIYAHLVGEEVDFRGQDEVVPPRKVPPAAELEHFMMHFISQMQISKQMFHPIEYAAICHKRLLEICPFKENNERVADFMLNYLLVEGGFIPITPKKEDAIAYEKALKAAQHPSSPDIDGLILLIAQSLVNEENLLLISK